MLVVVLSDESKAYEASRALNQLDREGSITIHAESVITKNADGTVAVKQADGDYPIRTVGGTAIGSLIGLLGGPVGLGVGALAGAMAGSLGDLFVAGVDSDFLSEVSAALSPGKHAVVADVSEEWVTPVDTRMEPLGAFVFRTTRKTFEDDQRARDVAELRAEIAQLKAEHAQAKAEHKVKLQAKIDQLNTKLQKSWSKPNRGQSKSRTRQKPRCGRCRKKPRKLRATSKRP